LFSGDANDTTVRFVETARHPSNVDFPEPEGPAIATSSPTSTRIVTPASATVSSSPT